MTAKLTLTIKKDVIERAKIYARKTGRSLSDLIEGHLENITGDNKNKKKISRKLKKIVGAVRLPKNLVMWQKIVGDFLRFVR